MKIIIIGIPIILLFIFFVACFIYNMNRPKEPFWKRFVGLCKKSYYIFQNIFGINVEFRPKTKSNAHNFMLEEGFDISFIKKEIEHIDINFILQECKKQISATHSNGDFIFNKIYNAKKQVIVLIGTNGSGKTTCCFKIRELLSKYNHKVAVCTTDIYKDSIISFQEDAKNSGAKIYNNPENILSSRKLAIHHIKKFIKEDDTILVMDTSGRNFKNTNLNTEIKCLIQDVKNQNIDCIVMLNINANSIIDNEEMEQIYDGIILSHLNKEAINSNIIKILNSYKKNNFSFISQTKDSDIEIFDKKIILECISYRIKKIKNKYKNTK